MGVRCFNCIEFVFAARHGIAHVCGTDQRRLGIEIATMTATIETPLAAVGKAISGIKAKHPEPDAGGRVPNAQIVEFHERQVDAWRAQAAEASLLAQHKSESGESELALVLSEWSERTMRAADERARYLTSAEYQEWLAGRQEWLAEATVDTVAADNSKRACAFGKGVRVVIAEDIDRRFWRYRSGQTGTVRYVLDDGGVEVLLDGYKREKLSNWWRRIWRGEGANLVPWRGVFKASELRVI
nr:hypothetical protein [Cupriavidus metallidurans]